MTRLLSIAFFSIFCVAFAAVSTAQTGDPVQDRIALLERHIFELEQKLNASAPAPTPTYPMGEGGSNADLEVRISGMEEQMRDLRGRVEQSENLSQQVLNQIQNLQADVEYRLDTLEGKGGGGQAAITPLNAPPAPAAVQDDKPRNGRAALRQALNSTAPEQEFDSPREHYNYAFRLLNQSKYKEAADAFYEFINKYPNDPLIGNAWYWGGEAHYIQRDYLSAADIFRQGFEAMPEGPKAADNLFKLALSLNALERKDEACVVMQQVVSLFKRTATNVVNKAEEQLKTLDCRG